MTDASGSVKGTASYDEYGVKLSNTLATRFTYNGQFGVEDDGTGMYYMRTRYYNVDLKRFMNRDVVVGSSNSAQSLNRYAYVNGNPISYTDPFGMARETLEQTQGLAGFDIHLLLDVVGLVPVVGEFADATNALLYLSKGQYGNAALSGAAMVPFAGNVVTGGKLGVKASGMLSSSKEALKRTLNSVLDFKFNVGRSTELAGYGRVFNDVSVRDIYQKFAVSNDRYKKLRKKSPNDKARKMVNSKGITKDPVFGYDVDRLEADHIVPMKKITEMNGFDKLSIEDQVDILNLEYNFMGLGKSSNASKGAKEWGEWKSHSKLGKVPDNISTDMVKRSGEIEKRIENEIGKRLGN